MAAATDEQGRQQVSPPLTSVKSTPVWDLERGFEPRDVAIDRQSNGSYGIIVATVKRLQQHHLTGIFIARAFGPAHLLGLVRAGDEILCINGVSLAQKSRDEIQALLHQTPAQLLLGVCWNPIGFLELLHEPPPVDPASLPPPPPVADLFSLHAARVTVDARQEDTEILAGLRAVRQQQYGAAIEHFLQALHVYYSPELNDKIMAAAAAPESSKANRTCHAVLGSLTKDKAGVYYLLGMAYKSLGSNKVRAQTAFTAAANLCCPALALNLSLKATDDVAFHAAVAQALQDQHKYFVAAVALRQAMMLAPQNEGLQASLTALLGHCSSEQIEFVAAGGAESPPSLFAGSPQ